MQSRRTAHNMHEEIMVGNGCAPDHGRRCYGRLRPRRRRVVVVGKVPPAAPEGGTPLKADGEGRAAAVGRGGPFLRATSTATLAAVTPSARTGAEWQTAPSPCALGVGCKDLGSARLHPANGSSRGA